MKTNQFNWAQKTLLIAEDDALSRKLMSLYLSPTGINVLWAKNGAEALDLINENRQTDLALLDIQMPIVNGFDVARFIKQQYSHIPIIIQTAYAIPEYRKLCDEIGCEEYLTKPLDKNRFLSAIEQQLIETEVI